MGVHKRTCGSRLLSAWWGSAANVGALEVRGSGKRLQYNGKVILERYFSIMW